MHFGIDIAAGVVLLSFLLAGWHKGFLISLLGVVRVVLAYGAAYFMGRYVGDWFGEFANRPRIVTVPVFAGMTFVTITFLFHVLMSNIRDEHKEKEEQEDIHLPWPSALGGAAINLGVGLFSAIFLFWLVDVVMVGYTGNPVPGARDSKFAGLARRGVYEAVNVALSREGRESQAAASARVVSDPARGRRHLENILEAESVLALAKDPAFAEDLMSGDAERIENNASLQSLFADRETLEEFKHLGLLSGNEKKSELCAGLAKFGGNEKIQASMESLKERQLLSSDKLTLLLRDPEFDVIVDELLN